MRNLAEGYPVVAVTGPRQSGKTTLVRAVFADRPFVSLEDLDERQLAMDDPRAFLARYPDGAVLDEMQRGPELFSYLLTIVDRDDRTGLFVLTGSQQSIAGEAAAERGWLVYGGDRNENRSEVEVVPWKRIGELSAAAAGRGP